MAKDSEMKDAKDRRKLSKEMNQDDVEQRQSLGKRLTSHRNDETGEYDVMIVEDGPDGIPKSTEVESSYATSPEANERIKQLKTEWNLAERTPADEAKGAKAAKHGSA